MSVDRAQVSRALYIEGGAQAASVRQALNADRGSMSLIDEVRRNLALQPGQAVLDVGCGTGEHLEALAGDVGETGRAVGIDFSPHAVEVAKRRTAEAFVSDAAAIDLPDCSFDAICCNYAIYYLADAAEALAEWRRLLKPSGRLVITGPGRNNNAELYRFHAEVTGSPPSDADLLANGYISEKIIPMLGSHGFAGIENTELTNRMVFSKTEFTTYWAATSLFLRTIAAEGREQAIAAARQHLPEGEPFVIHKKVTLVSATAA